MLRTFQVLRGDPKIRSFKKGINKKEIFPINRREIHQVTKINTAKIKNYIFFFCIQIIHHNWLVTSAQPPTNCSFASHFTWNLAHLLVLVTKHHSNNLYKKCLHIFWEWLNGFHDEKKQTTILPRSVKPVKLPRVPHRGWFLLKSSFFFWSTWRF